MLQTNLTTNDIVINTLKFSIENADEDYYKSSLRKQENWKMHSHFQRKLILENGVLILNLRRYWRFDENHKRIYKSIDYQSFLTKNQNLNVDVSLQQRILASYLKDSVSSRQLASNYNVSPSTVINIVHKNFDLLKTRNKLVDYRNQIQNENKTIYIAVDDAYFNTKFGKCNIQKCKSRMLNFFMLSEDRKPIYKNHLIFLGKPKLNKTLKELAINVKNVINKYYGMKNCQIIITGDGAKWIKMLSKLLKARYILCKFHLFSRFRAIFTDSFKLKQELFNLEIQIGFNLKHELYDLLWDCKYKEIYDLLIIYWSSICECFNKKRLRLLIDFANYLRSNMQGLYDLMLNDDEYYGNIAESYVSHLVKSKINKHYSIWSVNVAAMKILQNVENCGICVEIL